MGTILILSLTGMSWHVLAGLLDAVPDWHVLVVLVDTATVWHAWQCW